MFLPAPTDPTPRSFSVEVPLASGESVAARVDAYSDRLRCDHPVTEDGEALGEALREEAEEHGSGRVVVLAPGALAGGLADAGYQQEALIPGFYRGDEACAVMGLALEDERSGLAAPDKVAAVDAILEAKHGTTAAPRDVTTRRAVAEDAPAIAELIAETFTHYPTPSGDPAYIARAIERGVPFRLVRGDGDLLACASADLVPQARTAELTDCATRPEARGQGYMQVILGDLMGDLEQLSYPTAFTLARATVPGINVAFMRLGFDLCGRMQQSCRIGRGIEDMNVWSRRLPVGQAYAAA